MKSLIPALLLALLAGCATGPRIDHTYTATGQSPRVKYIVLHYTVQDKPTSIKILTGPRVSSHYLLTDDAEPVIYGLVPETEMSWHAGVSSWKGYTNLNTSSVGIEIVNGGWKETPEGRVYAPFPQAQVDALVALVRDIEKRYNISPENVVGHSDIAPGRKQDPGPMFPWKRLADEGLSIWPDATRVAAVRPAFDAQLPDIIWFQKKLAAFGYGVQQTCVFDEQTKNALSSFQSRFRQANLDGNPDAETATLLEVLTTPATAPLPAVQPVTPNAMCVSVLPAPVALAVRASNPDAQGATPFTGAAAVTAPVPAPQPAAVAPATPAAPVQQ
jgi:N-acetylmuramoyl-L-alanine amidase